MTSHTLLVLTLDQLYLAPLTGDPKPETLAAIQAGTDLDAVLGPLATVVELGAVKRLKLDLLANSLAIEYVGTGLGTSRVTLTFATPQAADAFFTRVWRRVGTGLKLTPYQRDSWSLARGPLLLLLATLLVTAVLVLVASLFEDMAATPGGAWLNWRTVCGLGGAAAAGWQVWLYRRLTSPPVSLELTRA